MLEMKMSGTEFAQYCYALRSVLDDCHEFWEYFPDVVGVDISGAKKWDRYPIKSVSIKGYGIVTTMTTYSDKKNSIMHLNLLEELHDLTFALGASVFTIYDYNYDLVVHEQFPLVEGSGEDFWFQQSTILDDRALFGTEFFSTLTELDSECFRVFVPQMLQFISENESGFDKLLKYKGLL